MRVAIAGGGLQGVELCWLARKAGWETLLVDRRPAPPALRLADGFVQADVTRLEAEGREAAERMAGADIVIPALEDAAALEALGAWCARRGLPFAFDPEAYAVTASKLRSRELFLRCGTPIPRPFASGEPQGPARNGGCAVQDAGEGLLSGPGTGGFPLIVKPSAGSGSRGVRLIRDAAEWAGLLAEGFDSQGWIVESWCPGPSYSLEICGTPGHYRVFQVTGLLMDEVFDCRGVLAPSDAPPAAIREMEAELLKLAEALRLRGLMDLEVILAPDGLRVLEIDARFPSQTPTAVWLSTGWNLAEYLVSCFIPYEPAPGWESPRCVRYEHVCRTEDGEIVCRGEHVMAGAGPLEGLRDFFGADEALLGGDFPSGAWAATLMFHGATPEEVEARRDACLARLRAASRSDGHHKTP
ncbi:MAG: ATP-grasp domain-containing protein [Bilophila sp.]